MKYEIVDVKKSLYNDELLSLLALSVYNPTPERLKERADRHINSQAHIYAYKENEQYCGIVALTLNQDEITIDNISTLENMRSKGVATKMLDFILKQFNAIKIIAETDDDAIGFYRKYGFTTSVCRKINDITRYKCVFIKPQFCFCGHDCSRCVTYLATVNNDDELRRQAQEFYRDFMKREIALYDINCHGGRSDDVFCLCNDCPFMKCCKAKGISTCSECDNQCSMFLEYGKKFVNKYNQV